MYIDMIINIYIYIYMIMYIYIHDYIYTHNYIYIFGDGGNMHPQTGTTASRFDCYPAGSFPMGMILGLDGPS